MKKRYGIWIDHRKAFLVSLDGGEAKIERVESEALDNVRAKGGWKAAGTAVAQAVSNEQRTEAIREHQLRDFYRSVIEMTDRADSIYIFGPDGAKKELEKEFRQMKGATDRIEAVETSDSMTENQIVAKVKTFYSVSDERLSPINRSA